MLVLKNCGPKGYPGMAEVGNMGLPPKVLQTGVTDMVRISDARMSGTAYGTVVLHVAPEAAVGGVLALVQDGDVIELDVDQRRLELKVADDELARRREAWRPPAPPVPARRLHRPLPRARAAGRHRRGFRLSRRVPRTQGWARISLTRGLSPLTKWD